MAPKSSGEAELALDQDHRRDGLRLAARLVANGSRRHLGILGLDRLRHIFGGKIVANKLIGIDPDPQRALGRKKRGAADSRDAPDLAEDIADHVVAKCDFVQCPIGRLQA